jgi:hypothetical protein
MLTRPALTTNDIAAYSILVRLHRRLGLRQRCWIQPKTLAHITKSVETAVKKALSAPKDAGNGTQRQLEQERKKLQNLIAAAPPQGA